MCHHSPLATAEGIVCRHCGLMLGNLYEVDNPPESFRLTFHQQYYYGAPKAGQAAPARLERALWRERMCFNNTQKERWLTRELIMHAKRIELPTALINEALLLVKKTKHIDLRLTGFTVSDFAALCLVYVLKQHRAFPSIDLLCRQTGTKLTMSLVWFTNLVGGVVAKCARPVEYLPALAKILNVPFDLETQAKALLMRFHTRRALNPRALAVAALYCAAKSQIGLSQNECAAVAHISAVTIRVHTKLLLRRQ
jgi:transcription initiation factor TFIIIB Brf1 subunit/transcription initiation factor TFIIB